MRSATRLAPVAIAAMLSLLAAGTAHAAIALRITSTGVTNVSPGAPTGNSADNAFEFAGGSLQTTYGLTVPTGSGATTSYLPPLERAVGQILMGGNRRGLFLPTTIGNSTGKPTDDGGTGVTQALTNSSNATYASSTTDFVSGNEETFKVERIGTMVKFTFGSAVLESDGRTSLGNINAFELRLRTAVPSGATIGDSIAFTNLVYNDTNTINQSIGSFSAADGASTIHLWDGIAAGDFSLVGKFIVSWNGNRPNNANLAAQVKLLQVPYLPPPVPEPASWAMLIAGFGLTGMAMRRRIIIA